jgi:meromycolic acid (3R)-3-hydroxyacyl-[acyl-carrier protein] dehydratase HadC
VALKTDIRGMIHNYPDHYVVGREKVREYTRAVKADDAASLDEAAASELGHPDIVAPPTFAAILAMLVQQDFFRHVDIGLEAMRIVQVEQRFIYHRPVCAGDALHARLEIHSVDERFGADIVVTRNVCTNDAGEMVLEAYTTLMGQQGDNSTQIKMSASQPV